MKKLINKLSGDNATPAKKAVVLAALITAAALVVAISVLVASSIIFAVGDSSDTDMTEDSQSGTAQNDNPISSAIEYKEVTKADLEAAMEKPEEFLSADKRIIKAGTNNYYYAKKGSPTVTKSAMNAAHNMFVDFYKNNLKSLNTDIGADKNNTDCNIPMVVDSSEGGTALKLAVFGKDVSISNSGIYAWLYTNAYKYGFACTGDTFVYVGTQVAAYMRSSGLTVDTLVSKLQASQEPIRASSECGLYYISADGTLNVPSNYEYSVIANSNSGYIIAVNMTKRLAQ